MVKPRFRTWMQMTVASLTLAGLWGCAGMVENPDTGSTVMAAAAQLHKGMKPDEVRQLLGNPARVRPVKVAEGKAERWIYPGARKTVVRQVAAGTREVPYVDPFTGEMRTIPEPVYADEAVTMTEELHLFWLNGELVEWKTEQRSNRSYTR